MHKYIQTLTVTNMFLDALVCISGWGNVPMILVPCIPLFLMEEHLLPVFEINFKSNKLKIQEK
jgi:hypothetical protein